MQELILIDTLSSDLRLEMTFVEGGALQMGSDDAEAYEWEKPVYEVTVGNFYLGKYPVTQALWKAVMGAENNPAFFRGDQRPVERVSWEDAQDFIDKLNGRQDVQDYLIGVGLAGARFRLPTEVEWEYAARGGRYWKDYPYKYSGSNKLKEVGWFDDNSHGETKPVGLKRPNKLGLYDMSGNVWEWVEDQWHDDYEGAPTDGFAWVDREEGADRVFRGGSWGNLAPRGCRVSSRSYWDPADRYFDVGFRLVLSLQSVG